MNSDHLTTVSTFPQAEYVCSAARSIAGRPSLLSWTLAMQFLSASVFAFALSATDFDVEIQELTHGPGHHFFGYIGHVQNIPWSGDGRYVVALRTSFQDRMPDPAEPADVVLIDTQNGNRIEKIDESHAWNFQQGTMFYWNPRAASRELIFNDRDPDTHKVFAAVYDVAARRRVREYRFDDTPFGNSGVAQRGGCFLGLNYGRMARLRPVTGYPGAFDWNPAEAAPANDGVFIVDMNTGEKRLSRGVFPCRGPPCPRVRQS